MKEDLLKRLEELREEYKSAPVDKKLPIILKAKVIKLALKHNYKDSLELGTWQALLTMLVW